jgi:hypothetical protein
LTGGEVLQYKSYIKNMCVNVFLLHTGVGARGLPEMHAQLYKLEQEAAMKKAAGLPLSKPRRTAGPQLGKANAGVAGANRSKPPSRVPSSPGAQGCTVRPLVSRRGHRSRGGQQPCLPAWTCLVWHRIVDGGVTSQCAPAQCSAGRLPCGLSWQISISSTRRGCLDRRSQSCRFPSGDWRSALHR